MTREAKGWPGAEAVVPYNSLKAVGPKDEGTVEEAPDVAMAGLVIVGEEATVKNQCVI